MHLSDIAAIVAVGFMPLDVGQMLPSKMYRFAISCARPQASTTTWRDQFPFCKFLKDASRFRG